MAEKKVYRFHIKKKIESNAFQFDSVFIMLYMMLLILSAKFQLIKIINP